MKILKVLTLSSALLISSLSAKECVNINDIEVNWTSYKTMSKVGVSGTFSKVDLLTEENKDTLKEALLNSFVKINLKDIDAKAEIKTNNILKYFVSYLDDSIIQAKIVSVYKDSLEVEIFLNNKRNIIPMNYKKDANKIIAKGVIDALDFDLSPALKVLNNNVAGHLNKGWFDIPISFDLSYNNKCK
jgi:hypothetical protein